MKVNIEMPRVATCAVTTCAYNVGRGCHARAITVGDDQHAACDTFLACEQHAQEVDRVAGVGACKVTGCRHNRDFECQAESIHVGFHRRHGDCMTYAPS